MKAIAIGLTVGLLSVMVVVHLDSRAEAQCESTCGPAVAVFVNLAFCLEVDNNSNRKFEDEGDFLWCSDSDEPQYGSVIFEDEESEDVNNVTVVPSTLINVHGCSDSFDVTVEGFLDELDEVGTCKITGFVWPPIPGLFNDHTITVHEVGGCS